LPGRAYRGARDCESEEGFLKEVADLREQQEVSLRKALLVIAALAALALVAGFLMFGNTSVGR